MSAIRGIGGRRIIAGIVAVVLLAPAGCTPGKRDRQPGTGPGVVLGPASEEPVEPHNEADLAFAQAMIDHHDQAVELASLGETRARDPKIRAAAGQIRLVQEAEISQLAGWLEEWTAQSPSPTAPATPTADVSPDADDSPDAEASPDVDDSPAAEASPDASPGAEASPTADPSPSGHPATPTATPTPGGSASPDPARTLAALREAPDDRFDRLFLTALIAHQERAVRIAAAEEQQGQHPGARELATRIAKAQRSEIEQLRRLGR